MSAASGFAAEAFALLGVSLAGTALRVGVRVLAAEGRGWKGLLVDDWLVVVASVCEILHGSP